MKFSHFLLSLIPCFVWAVPPRSIPEEFYNPFTLDGQIPVTYFYRDDSYTVRD